MEWLKELINRLLSIFPRVIILTPYEAGIRFTFGKNYKQINTGWYIYWPMIQRVESMEIQTQVIDLRNQSVRTKDGSSIVVSGAIQYSIRDIVKAIINVQDVDKALETLALGIILEFVKNKTIKEHQNIKALKDEIRKGIREAAQGWGLKIEKIYITDLDKARNIRLLTNKFDSKYEVK
jgi:regulator of protease activity HflC (stomatin/prohibitin superfamily)